MTTTTGCCPVAFKEWAGVCEALAIGRQSILLRKGGILEDAGPGAFVPEHREFWMYPTVVHQADQGLRGHDASAPTIDGAGPVAAIGLLARVEFIGRIRDEAILPALEPFHVLTDDAVRRRFRYRAPGLWVLVARIWRREPPFSVAVIPEHAGCKTWVHLDPPLPTDGLSPSLDDREWTMRASRLRAILGDEGPRLAPGGCGNGAA